MRKLHRVFKHALKRGYFCLLLSVFTTSFFISCSTNETDTSIMKESYSIEEGACGNIVLIERLGEDFEEAVQKYETEKSEFYLSFCPDEKPCSEIILEFVDLEVYNSNGKSPEVTFKGVMILDKDTGELLQSMSDAITSNGYHYTISWCPD